MDAQNTRIQDLQGKIYFLIELCTWESGTMNYSQRSDSWKQNLFNVICSFKVVNLIIKKYNDNFLNDVYWTFLEALLWPLGWLPRWLQQVWRVPQKKIWRQLVLGHGQVLRCLLQVCGGGKAKAMTSDQELNAVHLQTVFVNNPMCGLMMLVAIFIGHWKAGVGCVVGGKWWKLWYTWGREWIYINNAGNITINPFKTEG